MNDTMLMGKNVKNKIDRIITDKPSSIALVGESGVGKRFIAEHIADSLLYSTQVLGSNPQFVSIDAKTSGIDDVRSLQKSLSYTVPGKSEIRRVVVIENFDSFGHEAQNALLKTLEEPPLNTMIILTINNHADVLPTILSRVQTVKVTPVSYETATQVYSEIPERELKRAFLMSGGSAGLLSSLLTNQSDNELTAAIIQAKEILQLPKYRRLAIIDSLIKKPIISLPSLLDGLVRVLEASYRQSLQSASDNTIILARNRLQLAIETIDDINNGLNSKLALTRLFLAL